MFILSLETSTMTWVNKEKCLPEVAKKKVTSFMKKELVNQFVLLNNKELKKVGMMVLKILSFGLLDRIFKTDISYMMIEDKDYKSIKDAVNLIKKLSVKMQNASKNQKRR